jgi:peptide deformylase
MGTRRRERQSGKAVPTMAAHARHNSGHLDGYTWRDAVNEREKAALERGIRFEREPAEDDDEFSEAA